MNENPGEMPNPLNPNNNPLDANPAETQPLEQIVEEVQTVNVTPTDTPTVDPMARPMEQAPVVEPVQPKKKKTGLIVAGVVAAVVAIACGVTAALMLFLNNGDPVVKAVEKIASGKMPSFAELNGKITITPKDNTSPVSGVTIDLDSKTSTTSLLNNTKATVTTNFTSGDSANFTVEEAYGTNGDLYLKLGNIAESIRSLSQMSTNTGSGDIETTDCIEDEFGNTVCDEETVTTTNCEADDVNCLQTYGESESSETGLVDMLGAFSGVIDVIDGQWLRISMDEINSLSDSGITNPNDNSTCVIGVLSNYKNYSNSITEAYKNNPFISSTTEGVTLASKSGEPVRKIVLDNEKYNKFTSAMNNSQFVQDLLACGNESTDEVLDDSGSLNDMPTVYVEVDKDFNFTRVAFDMPVKSTSACECDEYDECDCDGELEETATMNLDLSLSYPETINVAEPAEYKDFSALLQELFTMMYMNPEIQPETPTNI